MIPFFHASGHFLYAKSVQIYLQDMYARETKVRRSEKFSCGVWTDMCIEQILMRSMKIKGGLTRGRGITDSVLAKWVLTCPTAVNMSDLIQNFCDVTFTSSEQHVDARSSRIDRDTKDLKRLIDFFTKWDPFAQSDILASLTTGITGHEKINYKDVVDKREKYVQTFILT